jgi:hypothetical protein
MNEHPVIRFSVYALFALLVVSSVILAMPGAFAPAKNDHTKDAMGTVLPEGQHRFKLNQTVSIRGISFTLTKVESDSRCPEATQCFAAGEAVLTMHVNTSSTEEDIRINTSTPTLYAPFSVRIVSLTPIPTTGDANTEAVIEIVDTSSLE